MQNVLGEPSVYSCLNMKKSVMVLCVAIFVTTVTIEITTLALNQKGFQYKNITKLCQYTKHFRLSPFIDVALCIYPTDDSQTLGILQQMLGYSPSTASILMGGNISNSEEVLNKLNKLLDP